MTNPGLRDGTYIERNEFLAAVTNTVAELPYPTEAEVAEDLAPIELKLNNLAIVNVKDKAYGAKGDGVTNDTAAFELARTAAGPGGSICAPPGTYRLKNFNLLTDQTIYGAGSSTLLKAFAGAEYVLGIIDGIQRTKVESLYIDGNAKAAVGIRIKGGTTSVQMLTFDHLRILNCSIGVEIPNSEPVNQTDKNTYIQVQFGDSTVGMKVNAVNSQEQLLINCSFDTCTTGVELHNGSFTMQGGQFQVGTTAFKITGPANWVDWQGVISEGYTTDIQSVEAAWPTQGVMLRQCVLQGPEYCVDPGTSSSAVLVAELCTFNTGKVGRATTADFRFYDLYCTFATGAAYTPSTSFDRRIKWHINGLEAHSHDGNFVGMTANSTPLSIDGLSGQAKPLQKYRVNSVVKSQINSGGAFVSADTAQGIVLKDNAGTPHFWRVTVNSSGVLVTADLGTTLPE